ncbi:MAG: hypothetical protein JXQ71_04250, partial [Verrucomicrobia bacterium]|nr:hypothetical protein [Verrucomicrobiota bacterium]
AQRQTRHGTIHWLPIGSGAWRARQRHSMFDVRCSAFGVRPSFCTNEGSACTAVVKNSVPPLRGGSKPFFGAKPLAGFA